MAGVNPIGNDPSGVSGIVQRLSTQLQQVEGLNQQQQGSVLQEDSQVANQLVTDLMQNQGQPLTCCEKEQLNQELSSVSQQIQSYNSSPCQGGQGGQGGNPFEPFGGQGFGGFPEEPMMPMGNGYPQGFPQQPMMPYGSSPYGPPGMPIGNTANPEPCQPPPCEPPQPEPQPQPQPGGHHHHHHHHHQEPPPTPIGNAGNPAPTPEPPPAPVANTTDQVYIPKSYFGSSSI